MQKNYISKITLKVYNIFKKQKCLYKQSMGSVLTFCFFLFENEWNSFYFFYCFFSTFQWTSLIIYMQKKFIWILHYGYIQLIATVQIWFFFLRKIKSKKTQLLLIQFCRIWSLIEWQMFEFYDVFKIGENTSNNVKIYKYIYIKG